MAATGFVIAAAIQSIGVARVFAGDAFKEGGGGLLPLPTEGAIQVNMPEEANKLTAPELTGAVAHDAFIVPGEPTVVVPVIVGDASLWSRLSASGTAGMGRNTPVRPSFQNLVIVPLREMTNTDPPMIGYDPDAEAPATPWTPAPPENALWFWKAVPRRPNFSLAWENGGKVILPVTYDVYFDASMPSDLKVFCIGDPVEQGVTGLEI